MTHEVRPRSCQHGDENALRPQRRLGVPSAPWRLVLTALAALIGLGFALARISAVPLRYLEEYCWTAGVGNTDKAGMLRLR